MPQLIQTKSIFYTESIKEPNKALKKYSLRKFYFKKWINYVNIGDSLGPFINGLVLSSSMKIKITKWSFKEDGTGNLQ